MKKYLIYYTNQSYSSNYITEAESVEDAVKNYVRWNNGSLDDLAQLNGESFDWAMSILRSLSIVEIVGEAIKLPEIFIKDLENYRANFQHGRLVEHEKAELKRLTDKYNDSLRTN